MPDREYLGGVPQPTTREREWASDLAGVLIDMVRKHQAGIDDLAELEAQIARELYCSVAMLNGGQ